MLQDTHTDVSFVWLGKLLGFKQWSKMKLISIDQPRGLGI